VNRRPLVAGVLAAVAVTTTGVLSACGAGQIAQTANVRPGVPGVNTQAPDGKRVYIRNAALAYRGPDGYPEGSNVPLQFWIFNGTEQVVTLVGVAAPADVVESTGDNSAAPCSVPRSLPPAAPPSVTAPSQTPSAASPSAKPGASKASASASASASPSAAPSPSPSPSVGSATIKVAIPAGGCVELTPRAANFLQLVNVPASVANTTAVPMVFSFTSDDGSSFTIGSQSDPVRLPVTTPESPEPRNS
jgi:hypothetical protein